MQFHTSQFKSVSPKRKRDNEVAYILVCLNRSRGLQLIKFRGCDVRSRNECEL